MPINDFFATLYELWGSAYLGTVQEPFSEPMYANSYYITIGLYMLGLSLLLPAIFYWIWAKQNWVKWYHWGAYLLINCFLNFAIGYNLASNSLFINPGIQANSTYLIVFALVNALWSGIAFFFFSFIRKLKFGRLKSPGVNTPF